MKIGIAGGIGSGKSFVCQRIESLGFKVYDCDQAAKRLIQTSAGMKTPLPLPGAAHAVIHRPGCDEDQSASSTNTQLSCSLQ